MRFLAVYAALGLPDACAALEQANGEADGPLYAAWWDKWVSDRYVMLDGNKLTGKDVYRMRCKAYHNGSLTMHEAVPTWERVAFSYAGGTMHKLVSARRQGDRPTLILDPKTFCVDICEGVVEWSKVASLTTNFQANWPKVWQFRPNGLEGHIHGVPVIA